MTWAVNESGLRLQSHYICDHTIPVNSPPVWRLGTIFRGETKVKFHYRPFTFHRLCHFPGIRMTSSQDFKFVSNATIWQKVSFDHGITFFTNNRTPEVKPLDSCSTTTAQVLRSCHLSICSWFDRYLRKGAFTNSLHYCHRGLHTEILCKYRGPDTLVSRFRTQKITSGRLFPRLGQTRSPQLKFSNFRYISDTKRTILISYSTKMVSSRLRSPNSRYHDAHFEIANTYSSGGPRHSLIYKYTPNHMAYLLYPQSISNVPRGFEISGARRKHVVCL
jgi:hypothetical protein